jgi:hypothetical protein
MNTQLQEAKGLKFIYKGRGQPSEEEEGNCQKQPENDKGKSECDLILPFICFVCLQIYPRLGFSIFRTGLLD